MFHSILDDVSDSFQFVDNLALAVPLKVVWSSSAVEMCHSAMLESSMNKKTEFNNVFN